MRYNNYHKHDHESNIETPDVIVKPKDYMKRAVELGHTTYFTTNHGGSGNVFEAYDLCKKYNLKCIFGAEAYYVDDISYKRHKDLEFINKLYKATVMQVLKEMNINFKFNINEYLRLNDIDSKEYKTNLDNLSKILKLTKNIREKIEEKYNERLDIIKKYDNKNYHIVIIGLTKNAYKKINKILSLANTEGYYRHPRVDLNMLLSLPKEEVVITTACVAGRLFVDNYIEKFLLPLKNHFGNNFMLEVQNHNEDIQIKWNKKVLELSKKYNIPIIHGCDSHYILPEDSKKRDKYIRGKGIYYQDEANFILDYPDSDTVFERYKQQGVLNEEQIKESLENTLIFDKAEDLNFDKKVKMPTIYPNLTVEERYKKLTSIIKDKLKIKLKEVPTSKYMEYVDAVKFELNIIKETNIEEVRTADYFLINERIIDKGVNEYGGILTKTGRGSAVSFLVNHLLGFTAIDRLESEVPLYPTRFMSAERILLSRSMPDIDFNTADPEPFIRASKDVLGEDGCYYMLAYGTLKMSGAFRLLCRAYNIPMEEYNEFGKLVSEVEKIKDKNKKETEYNCLLKNDKFGAILKESEDYVGVIDSVSPSPCSFLLLDKPISEEIGLRKINDVICCNIDGYTADIWKFLKNDILTVTVWKIISNVYKELNKKIPSIKELRKKLDSKVWKLYEDGITKTLNQADSEFATPLVMKYSPKTPAELTAWVAAIRPAFASLLKGFLNRIDYSTGTPELDNLLKTSFCYMLYQENIMSYLNWLGIPEDQTYDIIKKISKKKFKEDELESLKKVLQKGWIRIVGNDENFESTWQVMHDAAKYAFNSSHAYSVAWDSLYCAELKAHYPLIYYTIVFNIYQDNIAKIAELTNELKYFGIIQKPIKFRYSQAEYSYNKEQNTIFKGISSIKHLNSKVATELYELKENKYNDFIDLLIDIKEKTSLNSRQLKILTGLNFFKEFGKNKKLLNIIDIFEKIGNRKEINQKQIKDLNINEKVLKKYSGKTTEKLYKELDMKGYIKEITKDIEDKPLSIKEQVKFEMDYLEYCNYVNEKAGDDFYIVIGFKTFKDKTKPYLVLRQINSGEEIKTKIKQGKIFVENPFNLYDVLKVKEWKTQKKTKNIDGKWVKTDEDEQILFSYDVY